MLLFIPFVILMGTFAIVVASTLHAQGRKLTAREKVLAWVAVAIAFEVFYLFSLSQGGGSTANLVLGAMLPLITLGMGALTLWVVKD